MRHIALAVLLAFAASPALAATAPVYQSGGTPVPAVGIICLDAAANQVACGSSSSSSQATGQVSVGTTATLVVPQRISRTRVILNVNAANSCAFGNAGVTLTTGLPLQPVAGASLTVDTSAAEYAVCSATTTIGYLEQF